MANKIEVVLTARDQMSGQLKKAERRVDGFGKSLAKSFAMIGGAAAVTAGLRKVVLDAAEAELSVKNLETRLRSTGGASNMLLDELTALGDEFERTTRFSAEMVQGAEDILLTFTKIGRDTFPQAVETMLNMSTVLGQSLPSSAIQLGKALNDPIQGVTALRRVGVQLTQQQEDQIKAFMEVNDIASAQKIILGELETQMGGAAVAAGDTLLGAIDKLKNSIGAIGDAVVTANVPELTKDLNLLSGAFYEQADRLERVMALYESLPGLLKKSEGPFDGMLQRIKDTAEWFYTFDKGLVSLQQMVDFMRKAAGLEKIELAPLPITGYTGPEWLTAAGAAKIKTGGGGGGGAIAPEGDFIGPMQEMEALTGRMPGYVEAISTAMLGVAEASQQAGGEITGLSTEMQGLSAVGMTAASAISSAFGNFFASMTARGFEFGNAMKSMFSSLASQAANLLSQMALIGVSGMTGGPLGGLLGMIFQHGGIVPAFPGGGIMAMGPRLPHNHVLGAFEPGEMVLNRQQQSNLFRLLKSGGGGTGQPATVINNHYTITTPTLDAKSLRHFFRHGRGQHELRKAGF